MDWLKIQVIPETLGYILSFRVHVCSYEHYSDLSLVYRFVSLLYTSGTLTTYFLCNIEVSTELTLLNENNRSISVHMYARSNRNWMSVLGASKYARNTHYWMKIIGALIREHQCICMHGATIIGCLYSEHQSMHGTTIIGRICAEH